jgi:sarcosine oxidase subunit alpha
VHYPSWRQRCSARPRLRPKAGSQRSFKVDTVCVGYGFIPSVELTRLAQCEHHYEPTLGGWIPVRNANLETSVPGVYAAGDCTTTPSLGNTSTTVPGIYAFTSTGIGFSRRMTSPRRSPWLCSGRVGSRQRALLKLRFWNAESE